MRGCYHDPEKECPACHHYEAAIKDLLNVTWRRNRIKQVLVNEGDHHGNWTRVAQIRLIQETDEGLIVTVT